MEKRLSAPDLFGGEDIVLNKISKAIRDRWDNESKESKEYFLDDIEGSEIGCEIGEFLKGKRRVNIGILELLGMGYLGLHLNDMLGKPRFASDKIRDYWTEQLEVMPMLIAGLGPFQPVDKEIEFNFYISRRLIYELMNLDEGDYKKARKCIAA